MLETTWSDWSAEAEAALDRLRAKLPAGGRIVVAGLSMGGASRRGSAPGTTTWRGSCSSTPWWRARRCGAVEEGLAGGIDIFPGIGSDIADPDAHETSYEGTPLRPLVTLFDGVESFQSGLSSIACPVLILNSPQDHVVAPSNSDHLAASVGGPVERVTLERSYHVATLDYDKDLVTERFLEFTAKATAS